MAEGNNEEQARKVSLGMMLRFALVGMVLPAVGVIIFEGIRYSNSGEIELLWTGLPYIILLVISGFCAFIVGLLFQKKWSSNPILLYFVVIISPFVVIALLWIVFVIWWVFFSGVGG